MTKMDAEVSKDACARRRMGVLAKQLTFAKQTTDAASGAPVTAPGATELPAALPTTNNSSWAPPSKEAAQRLVEDTIAWIERYKVVPILRSKDPDLSIRRGVELANLGCRALEVTLDTPEWERVVSSLVQKTGETCLVGVGTVEDVDLEEGGEPGGLMRKVASLGARFALSPINPEGFVHHSLRFGVLPVPAAFSPQEIHTAMKQGAKVVKVFPAQLYSPETLKALRAVGSFGTKVHLMPSGGVSPENANQWIEVGGAVGVGMGSNLCGEDLRMVPKDTPKEKIEQAAEKWREQTAPMAKKLFAQYS